MLETLAQRVVAFARDRLSDERTEVGIRLNPALARESRRTLEERRLGGVAANRCYQGELAQRLRKRCA